MPELEINDIAKIGAVRDIPAYMLQPEWWTQALNVRARDEGLQTLLGWTQTWGTPGTPPHFILPVISSTAAWWLYTSLTKGYVWDGSSHTDITRTTGGNYTATNTRDWNGTIFGGIPILNSGFDVPQFWASYSVATKLQALTAWPSTYRCKVMRSFGAYLVAIYITKGSTPYPHTVKWSAEATQPGTLPPSWDETDLTNDAGEYDLYDVNAGVLTEALPLAGKMYLYKENSTWVMRFVGGRAVFGFDTLYETSGVLAPRCVAVTGDGRQHVVATQDDLIVHSGGEPASILNRRLRREVFSNMDTVNYVNSFMFVDPNNNEVYFCYPVTGAVNGQPNRAIIYNYKTGAVTEMDGVTFRNGAMGRIQNPDTELWSQGTDLWNEETGPWDTQERNRIILCGTDANMFFKWDNGLTRNGASFTKTLQRTGLALIGKKRSGEWIVNHQALKMLDRMWPKLKGDQVQIRFGYTDLIDGAITWGGYRTYTPGTDVYMDSDPPVSGRAVAIEITGTNQFRLDGYRINVVPLGNF